MEARIMELAQAITEMGRFLPQSGGKNKIRTVFDVSVFFRENVLMIITSDAISAFDFVMLNEIPGKGIVLNEISAWWFKKTSGICQNHFLTDDLEHIPVDIKRAQLSDQFQKLLLNHKDILKGRVMLVRKARPLPAEFIVRRYLLGSAYESYQKDGTVCGIKLPTGLKKGARLDQPIFTPSTKAQFGEHDINITYDQLANLLSENLSGDFCGRRVGKKYAKDIRQKSINLFEYAENVAALKGLTLQDTKFEFGILPDGTLILIDELFTPDNSRWTPDYTKQPFRDTLIRLGYGKTGPIYIGTPLAMETEQNYAKALFIITGKTLEQFLR
jgi:phosphoribosylaminoimidazole-succinocarboxamide synthase